MTYGTQPTQTQVAKKTNTESVGSIKDMLAKAKGAISQALPRYMNADRLIRVVMTSLQRNPKLLECHPYSLIGAVIQSAQLGLEPDGVTGQAYLVPFYNGKKNRLEVQFIPGYRGLIELCRRSGQLQSVEARVVHEKDKFEFAYGIMPTLVHEPSTVADPGVPMYAYAIWRFKDGGFHVEVMTKVDIDKIMARSPSKDKDRNVVGPWKTDYEEMMKKTVIRRSSKMVPLTVEAQMAVDLDDRANAGIPQDLAIIADPEGETSTEIDPELGMDDLPPPQRASEAKKI